jgi:1-acyl-sn-glycerol-3-phosphate acyltransferase
MPFFPPERLWLKFVRALIGFWVQGRRYAFTGLEPLQASFARCVAAPGPVLLCATHGSLADGPLLWWALSRTRAPWVVADPSDFPVAIRFFFPFFPRCVRIRQGGGLVAQRKARARLVRILERGETVLLFPGGTKGEPFSYLAGALMKDVARLRVVGLGIALTPKPTSWRIPERGAQVELSWRELSQNPASEGLRGIRERAVAVASALETLPC